MRRAHGATEREIRQRLITVFNTPFAPDLLVASSVMGEGIDLHRECRHVIHHDLDWNPSVLEQRTGRLDRIGALAETEHADIAVYEPYLAGTHDEKMFRVVKDRAGWFDVVMGAGVGGRRACYRRRGDSGAVGGTDCSGVGDGARFRVGMTTCWISARCQTVRLPSVAWIGPHRQRPQMAESLAEARHQLSEFGIPDVVAAAAISVVEIAEQAGIRVSVRTTIGQYVAASAAGRQIALYVDRTGISFTLDRERARGVKSEWPQVTLEDAGDAAPTAHIRISANQFKDGRGELAETLGTEAMRRSARGGAGRPPGRGERGPNEQPGEVCPRCTSIRAANGSCWCE